MVYQVMVAACILNANEMFNFTVQAFNFLETRSMSICTPNCGKWLPIVLDTSCKQANCKNDKQFFIRNLIDTN